jgi:hypothetical protein
LNPTKPNDFVVIRNFRPKRWNVRCRRKDHFILNSVVEFAGCYCARGSEEWSRTTGSTMEAWREGSSIARSQRLEVRESHGRVYLPQSWCAPYSTLRLARMRRDAVSLEQAASHDYWDSTSPRKFHRHTVGAEQRQTESSILFPSTV